MEDDADIRDVVSLHLARAGFDVRAAETAAAGWDAVRSAWPDIVVLDLMLPDGHGLDLCRRIREEGRPVGIVMLTALADESDQVAGLELGADDYVAKPFRPRELVARVRAVLRRISGKGTGGLLRAGPLVLDPARLAVTLNDRHVPLTAIEFGLLHALCERPGAVLTRAQLLDRVWGEGFFGGERTVDVHVRHIRAKLAAAGGEGFVETVRGMGYRIRDDGR